MKIFLIRVFVFIFFTTPILKAQLIQSVKDTVTNNLIETNFSNNINSANLTSRVYLNTDYKKFNLILKNTYTSDVTKLQDNFFRDNNEFKIIANYKISKKFLTGFGLQDKFLSDDKGIEVNKEKNRFYFANIDFIPNNDIYINTKIGIKNEDQIGERNSGFSGMLYTGITNLNIQNFISNSELNAGYDNLTEKTNYDVDLNTKVYKRFSENSFNKSTLRFYNMRNDFYIPATISITNNYNVINNIQSRIENYLYLENSLNYAFVKNLNFQIGGVYSLKNITSNYKYNSPPQSILFENIYDTRVNENLLQANTSLEYLSKMLFSKASIVYTERVEQHLPVNTDNFSSQILSELERTEKNKNNNSRTTSLVFESVFSPVNTHKFRFTSSSSILKYDTDSKENFDDRDELYLIALISHKYDNLQNFSIETAFEYNASKLSYLFKERSSNNNTNKIYKLSSRSIFIPVKQILTNNSVQLLANYTVYQFEDIISDIQSFSFRQIMFSDTTNYQISSRLYFDLFGNIKIYTQGTYNEKNFSEKPLAYYDERRFNGQLGYNITDFLRISIGYQHFIQRNYGYLSGTKFLKRTFANYGPMGKIIINMDKNSKIDISMLKEYLESSDNTSKTSSISVLIKILWNI